MQKLSNFTATLKPFVQLFDMQNDSGYKIGGGKPQSSLSDTDDIADEYDGHEEQHHEHESLLTELIRLAKERFPSNCAPNLECVEAIIDASLYHQGCLEISFENIIQNHQKHSTAILGRMLEEDRKSCSAYNEIAYDLQTAQKSLTLKNLTNASVWLKHQGPLLALGVSSCFEARWVFSRWLAEGDSFHRDYSIQNDQLTKCFNYLTHATCKTGTNLAPRLVELSNRLFKDNASHGRMTSSKVKKLIGCESDEALHLAEIYESLPHKPISWINEEQGAYNGI